MRRESHLEVAGAVVAALLLAAAVALAAGCGSVSVRESGVDGSQREASGETGANVGGKGGAQLLGGGGQQASGGAGGVAGAVGVDASGDLGADAVDDGGTPCEAGTGQSCVDGHLCMLSLGDAWIKCAACPGGGAHTSCGGTRWCCVTPPPAPTGVPWCADVIGCQL